MSEWQLLVYNPVIWLIIGLAFLCYSVIALLLTEAASDEWRQRTESWLDTLPNLLASIPLLGLLGTIVGLLSTFTQMSYGGLDLQALLSGGIADAMLTTQLGLITVIPGWLMLAVLHKKHGKVQAKHAQ